MKEFRYTLNEDGTVKCCGYGDFENVLTGTETFSTFEIVNYKKNLEANEWEYIMNVPLSISKLQATKHLLNINRHAELMAIIDADETGETRLLFDAAHQLDRNSDMVNKLGTAMGFSSEELDDLFIEANKILV